MVEHTREHPRFTEQHPAGKRSKLSLGTLYVPASLEAGKEAPLLLFMHGGTWLPEVAAAEHKMALLNIQSNKGYAVEFEKPGRFLDLIKEASAEAKLSWNEITVGGWSAGCQGIRQILRTPENVERINRVIFIDGIHTSYVGGKPGPLESRIDTEPLQPIVAFCRLAIEGTKRAIITHSEIFPGTFASTTETADWLLHELEVRRQATLIWGPMKTQQLSEAGKGRFTLFGFAGNAAPDHVDQLHALSDWLKLR